MYHRRINLLVIVG